jgi:hypothetical protein
LLLLLPLLLLLLPPPPPLSLLTSPTSAPDSGVSNPNFTVGFLLKFYIFFSGHCSIPTILCLV